MSNGEESRRFPRLSTRCHVRIRDRFGVWEAETEDVGPRGCRIVTPRPQTVGTMVSLTLESERVAGSLEVTGQIVWTLPERPARAGVSYAGGAAPGALAPATWFETILAAEREARAAGVPGPEIVIEIEQPEQATDTLVARLSQRARELLLGGDAGAAELIFRRALALAPGDTTLEAALRDLHVR